MSTNTLNRATQAGADVAGEATGQAREVASTAADEARGVASTAAERGGQLVQTAREETRDLAGTVRERASEVTGELAEQGRNVAEETREQVEARAAAATQQLAAAFRDLGEQAFALSNGRPEDAPTLSPYVQRAADSLYGTADRLYGVSEDISERGLSGVLDDLQSFARRRPGAFLLGAAALGFGVGRVVRAEKERRAEEDDGPYPARSSTGGAPVRRQAPLQSRVAR